MNSSSLFSFFFFNDTATTEIYTLSLHDALPISGRRAALPASSGRASAPDRGGVCGSGRRDRAVRPSGTSVRGAASDRKSTRLNSSHSQISYAVFCLKKKNTHLKSVYHDGRCQTR